MEELVREAERNESAKNGKEETEEFEVFEEEIIFDKESGKGGFFP